MHVSTWVWWLTVGLTSAILLLDVVLIGRRPHVPSMREVGGLLALYIGLAVLFGLGVWYFSSGAYAAQFYAGWLTEYSLSIDNLFVFLLIMARFGVPAQLQQTALMVGIVIALILRGVFIAVGAAVINEFAWVFYLFGAFLVYTAVKLAREGRLGGDDSTDDSTDDSNDDSKGSDYQESALLRWVGRRLPATSEYHGPRLTVVEQGRRLATPMLVVIVALGTTDLLFALDSIPAIYGLTKEPFLVLTANIFALMGLRQLYFLLGGLLRRLVYLGFGLAVLLGFIGVKLILHAMHENALPFINGGSPVPWAPELPIWLSLSLIVVILGVTTVASLVTSRREDRARRTAQRQAR